MPAVQLKDGLTKFRKEVIKTGRYIHPDTKQEFEVTVETLNHWKATFDRWTANGNQVPIPLGHEQDGKPEKNQGWVTEMAVEDNSLYCIMELVDPELALTTDVSICVEKKIIDGKGNVYDTLITHVALCTHPVIAGLEDFQKLSLSKGTNMEFLKKIAVKFGLADDASEEDINEVIDTLQLDVKPVKTKVEPVVVADPVVKLISENRAMKLSGLVKAGLITPAVKDVIQAKYVELNVLALSMGNDGFDTLYDVLVQNRPVNLDEVTGVQSFELSNRQVEQPNAMQKVVAQKRKEAGMKD